MSEVKQAPRFLPVIFANGEDDDTPGILAGINDEAVQYGERVYEPGEKILVHGCQLLLRRWLLEAVFEKQESGAPASGDTRFKMSRCTIWPIGGGG